MARREGLEAVIAAITEIEGDGDTWYPDNAGWPTARQIVENANLQANPSLETMHAVEVIQTVAPHIGFSALGGSTAA